jgi:hypothetical protein
MKKKILIINILILILCLPALSQNKQEDLKREVTLYNPYKPSLSDVKKRSFLPDANDTSRVKPDFKYNIATSPYTPEYTISPIKAASLQPDPLPKLYKSYVKIGLGNYFSPLAGISITNERSKKGALGFNARHFSTNGKVRINDSTKVFSGYMDNDVSLFGKKFLKGNVLEGSVDYIGRTRYAYGYDTTITGYVEPDKKDIRLAYNNIGAKLSFYSLTLDSSRFSYDFDVHYDFFASAKEMNQHNAGISGVMSTMFRGFYAGSGIQFEYFRPSEHIFNRSKFMFALSPFLKKSTQQWNFKAGLQLVLDKDTSESAKFRLYPDVSFGFSIVPSYVSFFAGLNGKLEINDPLHVIGENPFVLPDGPLYYLPNTSHSLIVSAGLKGNTGIGGNYLLSASYSLVNDMLFYSAFSFPADFIRPRYGNYFLPQADDAEILKVHGEMTGRITDKISYIGNANWYKYTLTALEYPWNKPSWDGQLGIKYNLRDKIIAGLDITALGKRKVAATMVDLLGTTQLLGNEYPFHLNLNLSAEYRYSKILSFWLKVNNIAFDRYYEWAWYPTQRFLCMVGFTYSL